MKAFWILQRIFNHVLLDHGTGVDTAALRVIVDCQADVLDQAARESRQRGMLELMTTRNRVATLNAVHTNQTPRRIYAIQR